MVELAEKNAKMALHDKFALIERDEERTIGAVEKLGKAMGIYPPYRIEAFDNSHIHGTDPVSALVVFTDGRPDKKNTVNTKSRRLKGRMTMNQCVKSSGGGIRGC